MHLGIPRVIGAWVVDDVVIDPGPTSCLPMLLEGLDGDRPRALLLTHIHLDHAGASGSLVERWPDLDVYVHERGARHMADPERLIKSARMLYGEDMDRRWGEMVPVPEKNLRMLRGGETLFGGAFEVAYTPGHASHHVSYLHDGTAFVGDTGGVRIASSSLTIPPSPPPDIDVELWHESIERIAAWKPRRLVQTHFGASDDPGGAARRAFGAARRLGGAGARSGARGVHRRRARRDRGARRPRAPRCVRASRSSRSAVRGPGAVLAQARRRRRRGLIGGREVS